MQKSKLLLLSWGCDNSLQVTIVINDKVVMSTIIIVAITQCHRKARWMLTLLAITLIAHPRIGGIDMIDRIGRIHSA
jgi:hypothetical protein